jgi:HEAT repeat protein
MGIYPELDHLDLEELMQRWHGEAIAPDDAIAYYDELAFLICKRESGIAALTKEISSSDLPRLSAILHHLPLHPAIQMLDYLHDDRPLIVARAIDRLQAEGADVLEQVLSLKSHPSAWVRGAVLRFVSKQAPQSAPSLLIEALRDPDYLVRMNAVDELDELPYVEAVPYLQPLVSDPHDDVREAAVSAIENLSRLLSRV